MFYLHDQINDFLKGKFLQEPNRCRIIFLYCCDSGENKGVHGPPAKLRLDAFLKQSHMSSLNWFLMAFLMTASFLHNKRSSDLWIHFFNLIITFNTLLKTMNQRRSQLVVFSIIWMKYEWINFVTKLKRLSSLARKSNIVQPTQVLFRE
jgi:hypothetical protein